MNYKKYLTFLSKVFLGKILFLLSFLITFVCCVKGAYASSHHYIDIHGNSLEKYDFVWEQLNPLFENKCPKIITIDYSDEKKYSFMNSDKNKITINVRDYHRYFTNVLAHETVHLCLAKSTNKVNELEEFRFLDDGYASIKGAFISKELDIYKKEALETAVRENLKGNVSFKLIQKWYEYFSKDCKNLNYNAYRVGSSFIFYLQDTYSPDIMQKLFKSITKTKNLEKSLQELFNKSLIKTEKEWLNYLVEYQNKHNISLKPIALAPQIIDIYPKHNAINIPVSIKEIFVKFNVPMNRNILSIGTYFPAVTYKNACWKDDTTLVIKIKEKLKKNFTYKVTIGTNFRRGSALYSVDGIKFPITDWVFTTEKQ